MTLNLRLGGKSAIKKSALLAGLGSLVSVNPEVMCVSAPSGIPEQPWGSATTTRGAYNRGSVAYLGGEPIQFHEVPENVLGCGLENGISENANDVYIDFAVVLLFFRGQFYSATSAGVQFPAKYVNEAKRRIAAGEVDLTVGKVISQYTGCDHADPHSYLTDGKFSRLKILTDCVALCASQFIR